MKSQDARVRYEAAIALQKLKDPRAVVPLIAALEDEDFHVQLQASGALARIGEPAVTPLIAALTNAKATVRSSAAYALGEIGDVRAIEPLIAVLGDEKVRMAAERALGRFGKPVVEPLIAALKSADVIVHDYARQALIDIGSPVVEPLLAVLQVADWQGRQDATMVLGDISAEPSTARLLVGLREHDSAIIVGAVRFFVRRGDSSSQDTLIQALNASGDVQMAVVLLNSGNSELMAAAKRWASDHGYHSISMPGVPVRWGERSGQ